MTSVSSLKLAVTISLCPSIACCIQQNIFPGCYDNNMVGICVVLAAKTISAILITSAIEDE